MDSISFPTYFGPGAWTLMLLLAILCNEDPTLKKCFSIIVEIFIKNIPCLECRKNAANHYSKNELTNLEKIDLIDWVVNFHNHANRLTNKPEWSVEKALKKLPINLRRVEKVSPGMWIFIHIVALNCKEMKQKHAFKIMLDIILYSLQRISPAYSLSSEYDEDEISYIIRNGNELDLFEYTVEFHNRVNKKLGKDLICFEDAYRVYSEVCEQCGK